MGPERLHDRVRRAAHPRREAGRPSRAPEIFLAGSAVFTVASMACGLAPTAELSIVFRIVQAVGAAALIPSSLALVMHAFAHEQLPRAVAIWGAAGAVAGALGPTWAPRSSKGSVGGGRSSSTSPSASTR